MVQKECQVLPIYTGYRFEVLIFQPLTFPKNSADWYCIPEASFKHYSKGDTSTITVLKHKILTAWDNKDYSSFKPQKIQLGTQGYITPLKSSKNFLDFHFSHAVIFSTCRQTSSAPYYFFSCYIDPSFLCIC